MPQTPVLPGDYFHIREAFCHHWLEGPWGWDALLLHRAGTSGATDDSHSLEVAAGGQEGYLRVSNIAFMSICRQMNHGSDDCLSLSTALLIAQTS